MTPRGTMRNGRTRARGARPTAAADTERDGPRDLPEVRRTLRNGGATRVRGFARAAMHTRLAPLRRRWEKRTAADRIAVCSKDWAAAKAVARSFRRPPLRARCAAQPAGSERVGDAQPAGRAKP